ncbi:MAG: biotin--[acetyl-CoA-carboxylase] ligase [Pirellulales bacterium]|nr:biotin--[acetyl-CoA-carboxylase] ligase [Pirellulales bacterium]
MHPATLKAPNAQTLCAQSWLRRVEWHERLDSTQILARQHSQTLPDQELPLLIGANEQSAGQGRGSHRWWTGAGALACSLLLDPRQFGGTNQPVPQLSLAVGVSLVEVIQQTSPQINIGLHWPNDLYCDVAQNSRSSLIAPAGSTAGTADSSRQFSRKKVGGILIEALPGGRLIIGVGVNTNNSFLVAENPSPVELRESACALVDLTGEALDHTQFLLAWMAELRAALELLYAHPERLGEEFDRHCLQRGETLTLYQGTAQYIGRCLGIATNGALRLQLPAGEREFTSGSLRRE